MRTPHYSGWPKSVLIREVLLYTHTHTRTYPQHVSLDHLNLRLVDCEFSVEAFAAYRSSQLQSPRGYILDPSSALTPLTIDLSDTDREREGGVVVDGTSGEGGDLSDLALV